MGLGTLSPLSSRAERGDPVNKKALRADARRHIITGLPQSYANVFNVPHFFAMTAVELPVFFVKNTAVIKGGWSFFVFKGFDTPRW